MHGSQVRTAVVAMLEAWAGVLPMERVLTPLADAVAAPKASSEGKLAGLRWLGTVLDKGRASKALAPAVRAAAVGVNDKAGDVREAGSSLMALLMEVVQLLIPTACNHLQELFRQLDLVCMVMIGKLNRTTVKDFTACCLLVSLTALHLKPSGRLQDIAASAWQYRCQCCIMLLVFATRRLCS